MHERNVALRSLLSPQALRDLKAAYTVFLGFPQPVILLAAPEATPLLRGIQAGVVTSASNHTPESQPLLASILKQSMMNNSQSGSSGAPRHKPPTVPRSGSQQPGEFGSVQPNRQGDGNMSDSRAKTILKEAVDAVVNSFAKHTQGYGRGRIYQFAL